MIRGGYGHRIQRVGPDHYRLSWTHDRKYAGSRLRHPVTVRRDTDEAGARRFAAKWGVRMPGGREAPGGTTPPGACG